MSVVYFKFRAQIAYDSILFDGHFISVGELKRLICQKKSIAEVAELVLSDPKSKQEYKEDSEQLPKGTQVIVRRAPAQPQSRVLVAATPLPAAAPPPAAGPNSTTNGTSASAGAQGASGDDLFGADPFAQAQASLAEEAAVARNAAMVAGVSGEPVGGPGRGMGGPGRGWGAAGRGGGRGKPPPAYHCRRCGEEGKHWEKDCPTQGDPAYDFKVTRNPIGIPVTKLTRNAEGALVLPTGEMGELVANTSSFQRQLDLMSGKPAAAEPPTVLQAALAQGAAEAKAQRSGPHLALEAGPGTTPPHGEAVVTPTDAAPSPSRVAVPKAEPQGTPGGDVAAASPAAGPAAGGSPAAAKPGLFDDDEPDHAAAPILLSSAAAQEPAAPPALAVTVVPDPKPVSPLVHAATAPPVPEDQLVLIPPDLRQPFCSPDDLWAHKEALLRVLPPRTSMTMCIEVFGQGRPLTRDEFMRYQKDLARRNRARDARSRSRERERARTTRGGRSRSRERARDSRRSGRDVSRDRSRDRRRGERSHRSARSRDRSRDYSRSRRHESSRPKSPSKNRHEDSGRPHHSRSGPGESGARDRERDRDKARERERDQDRGGHRRVKENGVERERGKEHVHEHVVKLEAEPEPEPKESSRLAKPAELTEAGRKRHRASNDGSPAHAEEDKDRRNGEAEPVAGPAVGAPTVPSTEGAKDAADAAMTDDGGIESRKQHRSSKHRRHREHKDRDRHHKKRKESRSSKHRSRSREDEGSGRHRSRSERDDKADRPRLTEKEREEREARREARREAKPVGRLLASAFQGI